MSHLGRELCHGSLVRQILFPTFWDSKVCLWQRLHRVIGLAFQHVVQMYGVMMCSFRVLARATPETGIHLEGMIYTDLIADCLLLCLSSFDGLVQQNNTATHCMQVTQNWLQEHLVDLQVFHWSPSLSDFDSWICYSP